MPQGRCAGPIIFLTYISALYDVVKEFLPTVGVYVDDTQVYISFKPNNLTQHSNISNIEQCVSAIRRWMLSHQLKINDKKTEIIFIGSKHKLMSFNLENITVGVSEIQPSDHVKNHGFIFDSYMNLNKQTNNVCKVSYFQLTKNRQIRKYISDSVAKKLIHAFISSSLAYCNSFYYGLPKYMIAKLQGVHRMLQLDSSLLLVNTSILLHFLGSCIGCQFLQESTLK